MKMSEFIEKCQDALEEKPLNVNFDAYLRILTLNDNIYSGASKQFVFSSSKNNVSFNSKLICTSLF